MKIILQTNKSQQKRADALLKEATQNTKGNAIVLVEEVDLNCFLLNENTAKFVMLETDDLKMFEKIKRQPKTKLNFCIVELKSVDDNTLFALEKLFEDKKTLVAVLIEKNLKHQFRFNYFFK